MRLLRYAEGLFYEFAALCVFSILFLAFAPYAEAIPAFSRQVGRDCTYCHTLVPKLNETGRTYRSNGYRFEAEGEWKNVKDWTLIPVSFEIAVEAVSTRAKANGVQTQSSDLAIDEIELMAGSSIGKSGKVSAFTAIEIKQNDAVGSTTYSTIVQQAFVQVNDVIGDSGQGRLNVKAGQDQLGLPFLSDRQRTVGRRYLAESKLGVLGRQQRVIELNGISIGEEDTWQPTHRYSAGVSREDINSDDKLKGYYAAYTATLKEAFSLGAIYRRGEERVGLNDAAYRKYGAAAEAAFGPVVIDAGYFRSDRKDAADLEGILIEALFVPKSKWSLGARLETVRQKGSQGAKSQSLMARYGILSSAWAQMDYITLDDDSLLIGANEKERTLTLSLSALF